MQHVETTDDHVEGLEPADFARAGDGDGRPLLRLPPVGVVLQLVRRDHHRAVVLVPGVQGALVAEVAVAKLRPLRAGSTARPLADASPAPALFDAQGEPLPRLTVGELLARPGLVVGRTREAVVVHDSAAGTRPLFQLAPRRVLAVLGYTADGAAYVYTGGATGFVPGGAPAIAWPTARPRVTRDLPRRPPGARRPLGRPEPPGPRGPGAGHDPPVGRDHGAGAELGPAACEGVGRRGRARGLRRQRARDAESTGRGAPLGRDGAAGPHRLVLGAGRPARRREAGGDGRDRAAAVGRAAGGFAGLDHPDAGRAAARAAWR